MPLNRDRTSRILLVDDDPNICRFISESLRLRGYEVDSFGSAELALEFFGQSCYDLALLDILLPGVNGLQLCQRLRSLSASRDMPIIMMTAFYKQSDHIREARQQYGATDYLLKPFPLKTLHAKIDQLLRLPDGQDKESGGRIDIKGNLSESPLPRILHNLYSLQATGLLHLEHGDLKKVVYIKNGYPIFVRSNLVREFLGQMLLRSGMLSAADLEKSLAAAKESGEKHGSALLSMGLLSQTQLNEVLRQQVIDKLLDIFTWPKGVYRFVQAREFKQGVTSITLSPANLILQGLRLHADQDQIRKMLEPHLDQYLQVAENPLYRFQEIQLSTQDQRVMQGCQGQWSLAEILQRHQLSRRQVEPLLATLLMTGILVGRPDPCGVRPEIMDEETSEVCAQRELFLKDYQWMMQQDYFTLFGVDDTSLRDQIRKAYLNLVKKYHPDRYFEQEILGDLRDKVNTLFQRINLAHETLIDPTLRAHYSHGLKNKPPEKNNLERFQQAEAAYHRGMFSFRKRDFAAALAEFDRAVESVPEEAEYLTYQAWMLFKTYPADASRMATARQTLFKSAGLNPRLAITHLYLGYLAKIEDKMKEARRSFERAVQCDPGCTDALRELRLIAMRRQKPEKKSILTGLFKK